MIRPRAKLLMLALFLAAPVASIAQGLQAVNEARRDLHSHANPSQVRVKHVDLDLTVLFAEKQLRGSAILDIERVAGASPRVPLVLDTRSLQVQAVSTSDGSEAPWKEAKYTLGAEDKVLGQALSITLPPTARRVRVAYRTSPTASALQWLDPPQTAGGQKPFLFSQSQAIHARTWIPLQDSPAVRVTYDATVRVPDGLKALMAADRLPAEGNAYKFAMTQPIPSYLIALAVGDLEFKDLGKRAGVWAEPSVLEAAAFEFADTEKMIEAVEARFGPYRWGRYDLLVLPPSFPFGGMENPKLTFATPTVLAGDRSLVDLVAHELAHSWSGNLVTNSTWRDFWLNEGFTTYLERRIVEDVFGAEHRAMEDVIQLQELRREIAELPKKDQILHIDLKDRDPDDAMTAIAYEKGARFLMALEQAFGRERFDAFLREYFDHFAFQSITTADFEAYLQDKLFTLDPEAAKKVSVHDWVHSPNLPTIDPPPTSERLERVAQQARDWAAGKLDIKRIDTQSWVTFEWVHFLRSLPQKLTAVQLAELDVAFGLTSRRNAEVAHAWLLKAIAGGHAPAEARTREFLTTIGRRKFIVPLYEALLKTPGGRERAREIYQAARPHYHPIATETLDRLVLGR
jgi:aminopeptidase N